MRSVYSTLNMLQAFHKCKEEREKLLMRIEALVTTEVSFRLHRTCFQRVAVLQRKNTLTMVHLDSCQNRGDGPDNDTDEDNDIIVEEGQIWWRQIW